MGFLDAGMIMKEAVQVIGLRTAAGLWVVAAVGIMIGAGEYTRGWSYSIGSAGVHQREGVRAIAIRPGPNVREKMTRKQQQR